MVQLYFWPLERVGQGCLQEGGGSEGHQRELPDGEPPNRDREAP